MRVKSKIQGDKIAVSVPYEPYFVRKARQLNGYYNTHNKYWEFNLQILENLKEILLEIFGENGFKKNIQRATVTISSFSNMDIIAKPAIGFILAEVDRYSKDKINIKSYDAIFPQGELYVDKDKNICLLLDELTKKAECIIFNVPVSKVLEMEAFCEINKYTLKVEETDGFNYNRYALEQLELQKDIYILELENLEKQLQKKRDEIDGLYANDELTD